MKTPSLTLAAATLSILTITTHAVDGKAIVDNDKIAIVILDDQTGLELEEKHGIVALDTEDLQPLTKAAMIGKQTFLLGHLSIDEDARDNFVAKLTISPFEGPEPPKPVSPNLPINKISEAKREYSAKRNAWINSVRAHKARIDQGVNDFIRNVLVTQGNIAHRFDEILASRNGADFNRSDIAGSIEMGSKHLLETKAKTKFLIVNSDAVDRPGQYRDIQVKPLTNDQLDPSVILIFVNRSFMPEREPIFRGLKNPSHHANTMADAVRLVLDATITQQPEG